ncbi:PREDICTED: patellin-3-like [Camelina sativa]|uniref:Patellin-3-like n=1 Tax=Camelina sativa TaxID=90675 RepID=A0ABM1RBE2_CAMSA|nr:PREDICTED: patellin-3-like [Camelina sativa]
MEWRRNNNIDAEIEGRLNVPEEFVFTHRHDREGNPVCYDFLYNGFERGIAEHHVASFVKTRILFMEKCIRKHYLTSGRIPSFLHVLDISSNPSGLSKRELDLVTELAKPALILAQEYYLGFSFKQIFNMDESPWWVRACNNMRSPRAAKEVEVAYPATSLCTLFR